MANYFYDGNKGKYIPTTTVPTAEAGVIYYDATGSKLKVCQDGITFEDAIYSGSSVGSYFSISPFIIYNRGIEGEIYTGDLMHQVIGTSGTITEVVSCLGIAPAGQSFKLDIRKNGIATTDSIFTNDVPLEISPTTTTVNGKRAVDPLRDAAAFLLRHDCRA